MTALERLLPNVISAKSLSRSEARLVMNELSRGEFDEELASQFLLALNRKSETSEEIAGFVDSLRSFAKPVQGLKNTEEMSGKMMDVCGTGGGKGSTFNVSTTVAFVVASAGVPVAKHGNRSVSSKCGSFDVLEALGLSFSDEGDRIARSFEKFNLGFLFAPSFHPALKSVSELRKKLGVKTVFNLLGPLLNPANVKRQMVGVYDLSLLEKISGALMGLGSIEAIVVHGEDSVDELSISASSQVAHLKNGVVKRYQITPEDFGLKRAKLSDVEGGGPEKNAQIILDVLNDKPGAPRDLVLLNAAFAFLASGLVSNPSEGIRLASENLSSKKPLKLLEAMRMYR
jgi:anthranilate phosphoribosyltransferase